MDFCENPFIRTYIEVNGERKYLKLFQYSPEKEKELVNNRINYVLIPCGKCYFCKNHYKSEWAHRMMLESNYHTSSYFITLTYAANRKWLNKRDLQLFIKRLRKHFSCCKLTYYASGEYGSLNGRPHFHLIVFDLPPLKIDFDGECYEISDIWKKGIVYVGIGEIGSFDYTAGYTAKKQGNYGLLNKKLRPFCIMSKGIGKQYFLDHYQEIYSWDKIVIPGGSETKAVHVPRYFDKLLDLKDPVLLKDTKKNREIALSFVNNGKLLCKNKDIINVYRQKLKQHNEKRERSLYKL